MSRALAANDNRCRLGSDRDPLRGPPRLLALALARCPPAPARGRVGTAGPAAPAPGTIPVVASTDVYGAVVRAVGGDRVAVTSLIDNPAADPHSYEAPPAAAAAVARARLVVVNGGGYDDFADAAGRRVPRRGDRRRRSSPG